MHAFSFDMVHTVDNDFAQSGAALVFGALGRKSAPLRLHEPCPL